jgi:hypothetical protein
MKTSGVPLPDVPFFNTPITKSAVDGNGADGANGVLPFLSLLRLSSSIELAARRRLLGADAPDHDVGA